MLRHSPLTSWPFRLRKASIRVRFSPRFLNTPGGVNSQNSCWRNGSGNTICMLWHTSTSPETFHLAWKKERGLINQVPDESLLDRVNRLIDEAFHHVVQQLIFFKAVAEKYDLPISDASEEGGVKAYRGMFASCSKKVLDGLALLWAMEWCCLDAWRFAESRARDCDGDALSKEFIQVWTHPRFNLRSLWAVLGRFWGRFGRPRTRWRRNRKS